MLRVPTDRRDFLRRAAFAGAGIALPFPLRRAMAAEPALIARRVFFENPEYRNVKISPDGKHLSYLAPLDGVRNLWVAPLDAPKNAQPLTRATDRDIKWDYRWAHTNRHLVFFRDRDGDENWRAASVDMTNGETILLSPERGVQAFIQEADHKFPDEMLLGHNQRDPHFFDLFRVNLLTGKGEPFFENHEYASLLTDSAFRLRLGGKIVGDGGMAWFERHDDGSWTPFTTIPIGDTDATELLDFSAGGGTLYLVDSRGRDKAAFLALDMATKETKVLAADDEADIVQVLFADRTPLAAQAIGARVRWHALDPVTENTLKALAAYDAGDLNLPAVDRAGDTAVAYFEHDTRSGDYVVLDRKTAAIKHLYVQHKAL
ncbi:MAG TPA: hypothetical protein VM782_16160, partial [Stellaceae bacterium]|nr:hypothetical protein [Stellaceae bacterium]